MLRSADLRPHGTGRFLHIHDGHGRRWPASGSQEVSGCIPASTESKLHTMAGSADTELPHRAVAVPDCKACMLSGMGIWS